MIALAGCAAACGGRDRVTEGGELVRAEVLPSMMGDAEVHARDLLVELTQTLTANLADPAVAEARVAAFVRVNNDDLLGVAEQIEARALSLRGLEAATYEEQLSLLMAQPWEDWSNALRALEVASPDHGRRVRAAVDAVERGRVRPDAAR